MAAQKTVFSQLAYWVTQPIIRKMEGSIPSLTTGGEYNLKQPQMVNHLSLSRHKDVRPPVKIAKVDAGKVPTSPDGEIGRHARLRIWCRKV